jgi:hypothetical protein
MRNSWRALFGAAIWLAASGTATAQDRDPAAEPAEAPAETPAAAPARPVKPLKTMAPAAKPKAPPSRGWLGVNLGLVAGDVDNTQCSDGTYECSEGGILRAYGLNLTVASKNAFRVRAILADEDNTDDKPVAMAVLVGPRLGRSPWYAMVGFGHVENPDDDYRGGANGLAYEFLLAPGAPIEFSVYGQTLGDVSFTGVAFGFRMGN